MLAGHGLAHQLRVEVLVETLDGFGFQRVAHSATKRVCLLVPRLGFGYFSDHSFDRLEFALVRHLHRVLQTHKLAVAGQVNRHESVRVRGARHHKLLLEVRAGGLWLDHGLIDPLVRGGEHKRAVLVFGRLPALATVPRVLEIALKTREVVLAVSTL